ncbi:MAG TPA: sigma-70 family RNA polymerase sigma factor [Polyangia bacterium]|jgi:RNA polymerase sigma-70 factor (ECF subfamily)
MSALVRAFREEASSVAVNRAERDGVALAQLLATLYTRGREAHPRIIVPEPAFGRYLARCAAEGKADPLADVAVEDVYLACACAEKVRGATAAFERHYGRVIRRAVSRVLATADERQEAEQRAWQQLLVGGAEGPPRITQYLGQGPLDKWISVASMRIAISFGRSESAERRLRDKAIAEASGIDPEHMFMKGELREAFEAAVQASLSRLKPRERLVLKLYLVSGMTLDAIGKSLGVTRQAVTKTLTHARETIVSEVDVSVRERLKLSKDDLTSVLRYVASQLDVSISRVLGKR